MNKWQNESMTNIILVFLFYHSTSVLSEMLTATAPTTTPQGQCHPKKLNPVLCPDFDKLVSATVYNSAPEDPCDGPLSKKFTIYKCTCKFGYSAVVKCNNINSEYSALPPPPDEECTAPPEYILSTTKMVDGYTTKTQCKAAYNTACNAPCNDRLRNNKTNPMPIRCCTN